MSGSPFPQITASLLCRRSLPGCAFQPRTDHAHAEPVGLAVTFASLLGLNSPSHASGRVLTEARPLPQQERNGAMGGSRWALLQTLAVSTVASASLGFS